MIADIASKSGNGRIVRIADAPNLRNERPHQGHPTPSEALLLTAKTALPAAPPQHQSRQYSPPEHTVPKLAIGPTITDAYLKLEKLEHTALVTKTLVELGRERPFPQEEVAKLVAWRAGQGLMRPGQAEDLCAACGVCSLAGRQVCA